MLGRCRRRVLVCDRGEPRNARSAALHGYLTRDGIAPAEFRDAARRELVPYGIELRCISVQNARREQNTFRVRLANGHVERSRFLLLATGVHDELPPVEGVSECYGRSVFHCPYCDGWEWRDRRLAVLGHKGVPLALSLKTWSDTVVLFANGGRVDASARGRLARNGVEVRPEKVARLAHDNGFVRAMVLTNGDRVTCDAVFFTTGQYQQHSLAERLGCMFTRKGTVNTGTLCETNVSAVFVAGDASRDAQFVIVAAAEGVKAAMAINQALQRQELRR
jgi:thioredoxin reductase